MLRFKSVYREILIGGHISRLFYVVDRTENDWVHCRLKDGCFEAFGGPKNLNEILAFFKQWAES
ncbi:Imm53 family immunity protein [Brevibacillus brevis]|uniref:Imm53 family immunity protein n=1 Tax=Brevibacillus brevis TaxID=1393 RepID=UPI0009EF3CAA